MKRIACAQCGKVFFDYASNERVVCSVSCFRARRKANQSVAIRCPACFKIFFARLCEDRKTCSRRCAGLLTPVSPHMRGNNYNFRGDNVTKWAQYKRANQIKTAGPCERCGSSGEVVHHKDENLRNNTPENLERLCRSCHIAHHRVQLKAGQNEIADRTGGSPC